MSVFGPEKKLKNAKKHTRPSASGQCKCNEVIYTVNCNQVITYYGENVKVTRASSGKNIFAWAYLAVRCGQQTKYFIALDILEAAESVKFNRKVEPPLVGLLLAT